MDVASGKGDVAQLGEHLLCKQGVVGSNPIVSTRLWPGVEANAVRSDGIVVEKFEVRCLLIQLAVRLVWEAPLVIRPHDCGYGFMFFVSVNQVLVRLWARLRSTGLTDMWVFRGLLF